MADLMPFHFHNQTVRTMQHDDGSTWWVAADVCAALKLSNPSRVCDRLQDDEKNTLTFSDSGGRPHELLLVNEPGLYRLLMRSSKPAAKEFQHWVFHDVLPQIRKTGAYTHSDAVARFPELKAIMELVQSTAEAKLLAEKAQQTADEANAKARLALNGQQWLTIRQYISIYELERQVYRRTQQEYGRYLTGLCLQRGIPVYQQRCIEGWEEGTYPSTIIQETLGPWLNRRHGQGGLGLA